jgi:hypothetical protein
LAVVDLKLDWCSQEAAKYAVTHWHYSRTMPASKLVRVGVWEGGRFRGCVLYGVGANRHLARPFGLRFTQACELVRVALATGREHPTSKVVAISLRMLHRQSPGIKVVVSYADLGREHYGTLYQAGNWIFLGPSNQSYLKVLGEVVHPRSIYDRYGKGGQSVAWLRQNVDPLAERVPMAPKLKYIFPFDKKLRRELLEIAKPYPKPAVEVTPGDTPGSLREREVRDLPDRSNSTRQREADP